MSHLFRHLKATSCSRSVVSAMPLRAKILQPEFRAFANRTMATAGPSPSSEDEVKFTSTGSVRSIILNRPKKLNSLNHNMVELIVPRLLEWSKSDQAKIIILKGEGEKSLCAGGDVAALAAGINEKGQQGSIEAAQYFHDEYQLDHLIATYPKPFVALQDGITMGGGVGLSIHAPFRVATEKTLFAMPETNIGFFPDVGATFFLPRLLDGQLGVYLGLTSARLKGYDAFYAGIATHYVPSNRIPDLEARLSELSTSSSAIANTEDLYQVINTTINDFTETVDNYKFPITPDQIKLINSAFAKETVEDIIAALEADGSEFALATKKTILERSPTAVKVALAAIRRGASMDIRTTLNEEFFLSEQFSHSPDFVEGVTALLIEKRKANWNPPTVDQVTSDVVNSFFEHRSDSTSPSGIKFFTEDSYSEYPHQFGLPSTAQVQAFVTGESSTRDFKATREEIVSHFVDATNGKYGVEQKVNAILDANTKPDPEHPTLLDWVY
ncbi:Ehd3p [Sugiyamaella lignohabitans]|uniref:3-hydroxyisobutyryl-CoA hydrolase n=1 Tax=Sugiyamaella lignohabitans TaxID=796027 RepID=A0A167EH75_9ASCO|nr:Ehd3p [Sugiyamaella lignohabitans]ANB14081.1 Ehd3p [Sugiyamaella lignohabitans]